MPLIPPLPHGRPPGGQASVVFAMFAIALVGIVVIAYAVGGVFYYQVEQQDAAREPERWRDVGKLTDLEFTPTGGAYITRIETEQGVWHVRGCVSSERMKFVQISDRGRLAIASKPYEIVR